MPEKQLPLNFELDDEMRFTNFFVCNSNFEADLLKRLCFLGHKGAFVYVCGKESTGKTHLLQACCNFYREKKKKFIYLPCKDIKSSHEEIFENLNSLDLVCLDDIEYLLSEERFERSLFRLYNNIFNENGIFVVSASKVPKLINCKLEDLKSRLTSGIVVLLKNLDDMEKKEILVRRAKTRGLFLENKSVNFLINNHYRGMRSLLNILDLLDSASLSSGRRITVPFIKKVLKKEEK